MLYSKHPYIIGLIVILLLPFVEEILFKAQIFKNTKSLDNHKVIKTIIIALLFACFHCITEIVTLNYKAIISMINYILFYYKRVNNLFYNVKKGLYKIIFNTVTVLLL